MNASRWPDGFNECDLNHDVAGVAQLGCAAVRGPPRFRPSRISAPRPVYAPVPEMPTAERIERQATREVEEGHLRNGDHLAFSQKTEKDDDARQALGRACEEDSSPLDRPAGLELP